MRLDHFVAAIVAVFLQSAASAQSANPIIQRGGIDVDGSRVGQLLIRSADARVMVGKIVGGRLQFSALPTPGTGFRIATAGDFDISGKSDLGILNTTQGEFGEFTIWKDMNPVRQVMWRQLKLVWDVQAVGDLDGDGYSDVVWRYVVPGSPDTGVS